MVQADMVERILNHPDREDLFNKPGYRRENLRVLAVGDPAQLRPIERDNFINPAPSPWAIEGEHDARLETIRRSGSGSSILSAAGAVRGPGYRDFDRMRELVGVSGCNVADFLAVDQVIAQSNEARWQVISAVRTTEGRTVGVPEIGERLVLLKNGDLGVNGEQFTVAKVEADQMPGCQAFATFDYYRLTFTDGQKAKVAKCSLTDYEGERYAGKTLARAGMAPMTFANAVTCHKAQGSEWGSVLVIDEPLAQSQEGWHYTALTRARDSVSLVPVAAMPTGWNVHESRALLDSWRSQVWASRALNGPQKVTADGIADLIEEGSSLRVPSADVVVARVGRTVSTVRHHETALRKAGLLAGKGSLTMIRLQEGAKRPSLVEQVYSRLMRGLPL